MLDYSETLCMIRDDAKDDSGCLDQITRINEILQLRFLVIDSIL